jgi:hypothetical protein
MKKTIFAIIISFSLILSACAGNATATAATTTTANTLAVTAAVSDSALNTDYTDAVSVATQLAVGTLNLDGTANALTKAQATSLVTLWESMQTLTQPGMSGQGGGMPGPNGAGQPGSQGSAPAANSSTQAATPAEQAATPAASQQTTADNSTKVDDLVNQIEAAMTTDQLSAIAAMQLTQTSITTILKAKGITTTDAGTAPQGGMSAPQGSTGTGAPQGTGTAANGNVPQGTPPAMNGTAAQGTPPAAMPTLDATQQANGQQPGNGQGQPGSNPQMGNNSQMVRPEILNGVIQYLANLAGVAVPTAQAQGNGGSAPAGGAPGGGSSSAITTVKATYTVDGKEDSQSSQTYTASAADTSAVFVTNSGKLTVANGTVTTTGNSSSTDNSSFYGLNAGVLANQGATLNMSGSTVTTSGIGANGVFSNGTGSTVTLADSTINATGDGGHAVMATLGGVMTVTNVNMTTSGGSASAIATDRGSGTINVSGGTVKTSGNNSAGIYSTGAITAKGTTLISSGAEVAVIEGANSITLTDSDLTSTKADKWGVLIYQSMSGDAEGTEGTFTMSGGKLTLSALGGPLFYVTNSTANIILKGVDASETSGILIKASSDKWGTSGANGGNAVVTADGQTLTGNVVADEISTVKLTLQNSSTLTGSLNSDKKAKLMDLTLDATSLWNVTADSSLTCLTDASGISGSNISNINGNGHTVFYDASACSTLKGLTYNLKGSGTLQPAK